MQIHAMFSKKSLRNIIIESNLFDEDFYLKMRPEVAAASVDPIDHYLEIGWKQGADPSTSFSTNFYLRNYPDVREAGVNPLIHYIKFGRHQSRLCRPKQPLIGTWPAPSPKAPSESEWERLPNHYLERNIEPQVDVLVPVYGGYDETLRCLYSVLNARQETKFRLLVINDASPDPRLVEVLSHLARKGWIELKTLKENLGFVGACNTGMLDAPARDVVLLNSDTEVYGNWLDRLRSAAYSDTNIATVTPFSNNAEICSYPKFIHDNWTALELPDAELDALAASVNAGKNVKIPTGVGFCMYIRRACLAEIGLLDQESFGRGYGEENDLCRRAEEFGWVNVLAADVFVRHYGGASFGASKLARIADAIKTVERLHPGYGELIRNFIEKDPIRPFREALDIARVQRRSARGAILSIVHNWGGGTEEHVDDMSRLILSSGLAALRCTVVKEDAKLIQITEDGCADLPNLPAINLSTDLEKFSERLAAFQISHVHIHHLAGFPGETADLIRIACDRASLSYDVTLHDYMAICPRINLIDRSGVYCGEPEISTCEKCIQRDGSPFGKPAVWSWREQYGRLLRGARKVYVPNGDVADRFSRYFSDISFVVKPHPEFMLSAPLVVQKSRQKDMRRRIALVGALGPHKGSIILEKVAKAARQMELPLEFYVVGYTDRDDTLRSIGNVYITGRYPKEKGAELLKKAEADFVFFSAIWPETYSYTLSIAFAVGLLPVAFDLGAIADRIKAMQFGKVLPLDLMAKPSDLAFYLASLEIPETVMPTNYTRVTDGDFLKSYYELEAL